MPAAAPATDTKKPATPPPAKDDKSKAAGDKNAAGGKGGADTAAPGAKPPEAKAGAAQKAGADQGKAAGPTAQNTGAAQGGGASQQRFDRMAVRAKLAVSEPGDAAEREADAVADRVSRALDPAQAPAGSAGGAGTKGKAPATATGPDAPAAAPGKTAGQAPAPAKAPAAGPAGRQDTTPVSRAVAQQEARPNASTPPPEESGGSEPERGTDPSLSIKSQLGQGEALPEDVRARLEGQLGHDFSQVRIHQDARADQLCRQLGALAFTTGNDIFFAHGRYQPNTKTGLALLAHELTHVVQHQDAGPVIARKVDPDLDSKYKPRNEAATEAALKALDQLDVPAVKARHLTYYQGVPLKRKRGYTRGNPAQIGVWNAGITITEDKIRQKLKGRGLTNVPDDAGESFKLQLGNKKKPQSKSIKQLQKLLKIPTWTRYGKPVKNGFQVDHIVELQVSGENGTGTGNSIENMELLDQPSNSSSGGAIRAGIYSKVDAYLNSFKAPQPKRKTFLKNHDLVFGSVKANLKTGADASDSAWWNLAEIKDAKPLETAEKAPDVDEEGTDKEFLLADAPGGIVIQRIAHKSGTGSFPITGTAQSAVSGLTLKNLSITEAAKKGSGTVGSLEATWKLPDKWKHAKPDVTLTLTGDGKYRGYPSKLGKQALHFENMSQVDFDDVLIEDGKILGEGQLTPSIPLLNAPIMVRLDGDDIEFFIQFSSDQINLSAPGVTVDEATVEAAYSVANGFKLGGDIFFTITNVADGTLKAVFSQGSGLSVEGKVDFQSELFDKATITASWSEKEKFGAKGELEISKPGKIKGIKSAKLTVGYTQLSQTFTASGNAETDIPGVKNFTADAKFKDEENFSINGKAELEKLPGIKSGHLDMTLAKAEGAWSLEGKASAVPDLPKGLSGSFGGSYKDGLVDLNGQLTYEDSKIFSGSSISIGVTNGGADDDGKPLGQGGGKEFVVYGTGKLKAKLTDTITGDATIKLKKDGSIRIAGTITKAEAKVFERYPKEEDSRKTLFDMTSPKIPVPGLGISVGGVAVGLNLSLKGGLYSDAWVGPGAFKNISVEVKEFNPAEVTLDKLSFGGSAKFEVPAYAGLAADINARLTLDAGVASVGGSIGIEGKAGVEPKIEANPKFTWSYADGLDVESDVTATLKPILSLGINGKLFAEANLLVKTVTLWEKKFDGPEYKLDPKISFSAKMSAGYNSATNKVRFGRPEFQTPDIDVGEMMASIMSKGSEHTETTPNGDDKVKQKADENAPEAVSESAPEASPAEATEGTTTDPRKPRAISANSAAGGAASTARDPGRAIGTGQPLDQATRGHFEQSMQADFSQVQIHTGAEAAEEAQRLSARAFTVGQHIAFAEGEFRPDTEEGRALLAHELAHVVQQSGNSPEALMRCATTTSPTATAAAGGNCFSVASGPYAGASLCTDAGNRCFSLPTIRLPALKERNSTLFPTPLPVRQGARPATDQTNLWRAAVQGSAQTRLNELMTAAQTAGAVDDSSGQTLYFLTLNRDPDFLLFGTEDTLRPRIEIPIWDKRARATNYQVDHVREMQLDGVDADSNYELLEGEANMGAGRAIAEQIRDTMQGGLEALRTANPTATTIPAPTSWRNVKNSYRVSYAAIRWNLPHDGSANGSRFWSRQEVLDGDHSAMLRPMRAAERTRMGRASSPAIFPSMSGGEPLPSVRTPRRDWIPRVDLVAWTPTDDATGDTLGTLSVDVLKARSGAARASGVAVPPDYPAQSWTVKRVPGLNAGYVDPASVSMGVRNSLRLPGMSPIEMGEVSLSRAGLNGEGRVLPTVPLIADADIRIRISGDEAQVYKSFAMDELALPAPFHMDGCDLTVFYGTRSGLGLEGRADFSVDRLGSGFLGATASTEGGFALAGGFDFDSQLFDRASVTMEYRNDQLSLAGDIGIDTPDKIRGIRAANLHMEYAAGSFEASGTVDPDLPGVRQAGLRVNYGEETGLVIGGNLELEENAAIRSGSIDVTLSKQDERWRVAATGTAQPAIPGVDSTLSVAYDDGAFDASFEGSFERGMLSGTAEVGATNRTLDASGEPTGPAEPGAPIIVYGGGSATIQIAPWLQGTAGIRFAPNGECTVSGEIGLPDTLELFPRQEIDRELFSLSTQIPIVPGVVAEVGGNLRATAGIGPGELDEARIGIEYNPEHEEDTHVTGDAHLNVPADAGLRLGARAGVGLGITGASATGGIELGGALGIAGAAEASVHVDWMPSQGLQIDAEAALHAAPRFRFDISGYVAVTALGADIYDETWELAAYEVGADYEFGVRFPVSYREGEPFSISTDDIEFEVPEIDTDSLIGQIGAEIF